MNGQNQTQQAIDPTTRFVVTLQAQEWNAVLACMAKATYEMAAPLIQGISQQLHNQAGGDATTNANGLDTGQPLSVPPN
jgi:hypothetical protein